MSMADSARRPRKRLERRGLARLERVAVVTRGAVHTGPFTPAFPDQVGLHPDDGVAPAHLAARHRFKNERIAPRIGELEHHRDGRVEIGGQPGIDQLVPAGVPPGPLEIRELGGSGPWPRAHGNCACTAFDHALIEADARIVLQRAPVAFRKCPAPWIARRSDRGSATACRCRPHRARRGSPRRAARYGPSARRGSPRHRRGRRARRPAPRAVGGMSGMMSCRRSCVSVATSPRLSSAAPGGDLAHQLIGARRQSLAERRHAPGLGDLVLDLGKGRHGPAARSRRGGARRARHRKGPAPRESRALRPHARPRGRRHRPRSRPRRLG